jgi:hypothetical protein
MSELALGEPGPCLKEKELVGGESGGVREEKDMRGELLRFGDPGRTGDRPPFDEPGDEDRRGDRLGEPNRPPKRDVGAPTNLASIR